MAYTVGFGKLERKIISNDNLPADVQEARIKFKQKIRAHYKDPENVKLEVFENGHHRYMAEASDKGKKPHRFAQVLPKAGHGETYYEYQVGRATAATPSDPNARGERRLVALVDAGAKIREMYFTEDHYVAENWMQLQEP